MAFEPSDATYGFPYETPYDVQKQLMDHLYRSFAHGQVTVVESPTGTGKSLSLISSSLSFLRDAKAHARHEVVASIRESVAASESMKDEPAWVIEHEIKTKLEELDRQERDLEERLSEIREREKRERAQAAREQGRSLTKKRQKLSDEEKREQDDEQFAPTPYHEDGSEPVASDASVQQDADDNHSPAVRALLDAMSGKSKARQEEEEEPDVRKIYFASRTHSQLSQFVAELRKTAFARSDDPYPSPTLPTSSATSAPTPEASRPVRIIPLGSRQTLCINDDVRRKSGGSNEAMGDLCTELQKGGKDRCPYLPPLTEPAKLNDFRDKALASVHDIEDIEDLGRKTQTCPYYGSRKAVRAAEVVTLPYNMLMQKTAREALGLSLKDHIVIVDEAHNLIDSILSLHSVSVTTSQLLTIRQALLTYIQKFRSRFTGLNASYLKQLALLLKGLSAFAEGWSTGGKKEEMVQVAKVFAAGGATALDQINLRKLDEYLQKSKIARKIGGYVDSVAEEKTASGRQAVRANATRALQHIQQFILSLANASRDGRILLSQTTKLAGKDGAEGKTEVTLKYMLLAPAESFRDVAEEAKAVVLAGGTMAPMSDFREQLFPFVPQERFSTFSCGHVVPKENVLTYAVTKGPTGVPFNFTFERRKDEKLLDELGQAIVNIAAVVPKGVVVFVPSYDFLHHAQARWEKSGMIKRLGAKKLTFWEPKASADVDLVLREFAAGNAGDGKGSILFAVVGAKLSEGINFADDMARAVVVCGIPYPNSQSAELKERMAYLKNAGPGSRPAGAPDAGQVLYQNLAFRAVNQSIGRAIRNARDWASIILLDERYTQPAKKAQLPRWLGDDVQSPATFGALIQGVAQFSRARRAAQAKETAQ
ncbi:helicase C-terminal domain-containing protein [Rhodotorula diobovata]|uniref:ATP-dependent DNA helicase CHL1 n=1 Tax=Rhodotorula diobovata TaxID=5288 RepID=A0A5C5G2Q4_9BASI|nr:helicase C-terminal domain-containing protein [Rhodotorula diobovata]